MEKSATWEVLVVDNNSTDQTREIVQGFCTEHPDRFRYLFEATPGKSYALNTGIRNARGQVLAFVDDDVSVEPTWLQSLTAELLRDGSLAGTGGRTLPAERFTLPDWLPRGSLPIVYPHFDLGDRPIKLNHPPYGANMAFRRSIFEKHGGFRVDLGPSPHSEIRNEDTEFGRRILSSGERLRYEPSAIVYHPVPQGRVTTEYLLSWWFDYGRALIKERGDRPDVFGIPWDYLSFAHRLTEISTHTLLGVLAASPSQTFAHKCEVWKNRGQIAEIRRRTAERRRENSFAAIR